jgi:hypothetical protein
LLAVVEWDYNHFTAGRLERERERDVQTTLASGVEEAIELSERMMSQRKKTRKTN